MWKEQLTEFVGNAKNLVIFCMGNEMRGDDAVGIVIARGIKEEVEYPTLLVHNVPMNFIGKLPTFNCTDLLIIDAIDSGDIPGTVGLFKPEQVVSFATSTHVQEFDKLQEILRMHLEVLPNMRILGVQIKHNQFGDEMSEEVELSSRDIITVMTKL